MVSYHGIIRFLPEFHSLRINPHVSFSGRNIVQSSYFSSLFESFEAYSESEISTLLDSFNPPELDYLNYLDYANEFSKMYNIRINKFRIIPLDSLLSLPCYQLEKLTLVYQFLCSNFGARRYFIRISNRYFSLSELKFEVDISSEDFVIDNYDFTSTHFIFNPSSLVTFSGKVTFPDTRLRGVPLPKYSPEQLLQMPLSFKAALEDEIVIDMNSLNFVLEGNIGRPYYFVENPLYVTSYFTISEKCTSINVYEYSSDWKGSVTASNVKHFYPEMRASFTNFGNPYISYFMIPTEFSNYYYNDKLIKETKNKYVCYSFPRAGSYFDFSDIFGDYKTFDPTLCCLAQCFGITE